MVVSTPRRGIEEKIAIGMQFKQTLIRIVLGKKNFELILTFL